MFPYEVQYQTDRIRNTTSLTCNDQNMIRGHLLWARRASRAPKHNPTILCLYIQIFFCAVAVRIWSTG
jgi:hypothetical protein